MNINFVSSTPSSSSLPKLLLSSPPFPCLFKQVMKGPAYIMIYLLPNYDRLHVIRNTIPDNKEHCNAKLG